MLARRTLCFPLAAAALMLGCLASEPPPVALYPNAAAAPLPPAQVATLVGTIARVDNRDVTDLGGPFALLPGCHVVELTRQIPNNGFGLSGGVYWTGQLPAVTFALQMKAGARYVIRRDIIMGSGQMGRLVTSTREEVPGVGATELSPPTSPDDIAACRSAPGAAIIH